MTLDIPHSADACYNEDYWNRYEIYARSEMGRLLNLHRVGLCWRHHVTTLVDVGIGCGSFVQAARLAGIAAYGFDINPVGVDWLWRAGLYRDPYEGVDAVTLWDCFEHLTVECADRLLSAVKKTIVMTIPIWPHSTWEGVEQWRHFRSDEHRFVFTQQGLLRFMDERGWDCVHVDDQESKIGRLDSWSLVFERR